MTSVSTEIYLTCVEIIGLLNRAKEISHFSMLTDRLHFMAFKLSEYDHQASQVVRQIALIIEKYDQDCPCGCEHQHLPDKRQYDLFVRISDQVDLLAVIATEHSLAGN
ncbi:hypothetical protein [Aliamphritea ceti]|uniref:hypothetical protein n=1 Tax=Aliamphritea ceti TaxID=1524258 RepID=UPI0021C267D6|nr:hypothetical protein [Aliamphritea ceti]